MQLTGNRILKPSNAAFMLMLTFPALEQLNIFCHSTEAGSLVVQAEWMKMAFMGLSGVTCRSRLHQPKAAPVAQ